MNSPTLQAWTVDLSDEATRGRAMATLYIALELGIGLGALAAGWFFTHLATQALPFAFALSAGLAVVAVGYLVMVRNKLKATAR
jgi:predicted MFS family arabinose efflux permease